MLHKTCWVDTTLCSKEWTVVVRVIAIRYTVHVVPARSMQLVVVECNVSFEVLCIYRDQTIPEAENMSIQTKVVF